MIRARFASLFRGISAAVLARPILRRRAPIVGSGATRNRARALVHAGRPIGSRSPVPVGQKRRGSIIRRHILTNGLAIDSTERRTLSGSQVPWAREIVDRMDLFSGVTSESRHGQFIVHGWRERDRQCGIQMDYADRISRPTKSRAQQTSCGEASLG
jgi:hypothetical protein